MFVSLRSPLQQALLIGSALLLSACSLMPDYPARYLEAPMTVPAEGVIEPEEIVIEKSEEGQSDLLTRLYQQYNEWHGVKYKRGGQSKSGIDCSGFVRQTYSTLFNIKLPRDTGLQAKKGVDVEKNQLRSGDLVFFRINKKTQHVGIYLEENKFLHASTSRGVMISSMTHPYWQNRYWKSVRVEG
jgi:lipoprotein Spr/probable lipoprotein NlpC